LISPYLSRTMTNFKDYQLLTKQAISLIEGEKDLIANLSNISALLNMNIDDINWLGFYLLKDEQLVLGPFQGNVACVRIALNKGVCGKAFSSNTVQRISDVHDFPGHIACDIASRSEIVLPINVDGKTQGVLDIDSPMLNRFNEIDQQGLTYFVEHVQSKLGF
jgi:L-methionine (R)-S-oxide reductase